MHARKILLLVAASLLLLATATAFQLAVAPTHVDEGVRERGATFHTGFRVLASEDADIGITVERGSIQAFRRFNPGDAEHFSAEYCRECVDFLPGKSGGSIDERGQSVKTGGGEFNRWKDVEFLYEVPGDMEPGYHMITVTPSPDVSGGGGGVSVVSSSSFPVMFRVPGRAVRSGNIIGLRAGISSGNRQEIVATFHNNGTVTMDVKAIFEVDTGNGTVEVGTGGLLVEPGESKEFSSFVSEDLGNEFHVRAIVDYGTGNVTREATLSPSRFAGAPLEPGEETRLPFSTLVLLLVLALTTFVTWKVVRD